VSIALNRFYVRQGSAAYWQSRPRLLISEEPTLSELLKEPIILALMASDGVTRHDILELTRGKGRSTRLKVLAETAAE